MSADERLGLPLVSILLAVVLFMFVWPSGRYLQVHRFDVLDAAAGQVPVVDYQRDILRSFDGEWQVTIYRDNVNHCTAQGQTRYGADVDLPEVVDLAWLTYTNPSCFENLPEGQYEVDLLIKINPAASFLWRRDVRRNDRFSVVAAHG